VSAAVLGIAIAAPWVPARRVTCASTGTARSPTLRRRRRMADHGLGPGPLPVAIGGCHVGPLKGGSGAGLGPTRTVLNSSRINEGARSLGVGVVAEDRVVARGLEVLAQLSVPNYYYRSIHRPKRP
jgi:hypothetical protein